MSKTEVSTRAFAPWSELLFFKNYYTHVCLLIILIHLVQDVLCGGEHECRERVHLPPKESQHHEKRARRTPTPPTLQHSLDLAVQRVERAQKGVFRVAEGRAVAAAAAPASFCAIAVGSSAAVAEVVRFFQVLALEHASPRRRGCCGGGGSGG